MTELTIKRLGHQGDGIADNAGKDIYIPFSLPGEVVDGQIDGHQLLNAKIITPSEVRVKAPCSHFKSCGGCSLQHVSDGFLAEWKTDIVRSALAAYGIDAPFRSIETSPAKSRRRATFTGRRTKKSTLIGFHGKASNTIIPIPNCTLLHPDILTSDPALKELTALGASRSNTISLSVTHSASGLDIDVIGAKEADGPLLIRLGQLAEQYKLARLSWNSDVIAFRLAPVQIMGKAKVTPPNGAFLQATEQGQDALTNAVLEIVADAKTVVDLFAGCGTFTLPLLENAKVHAVENEGDHLEALAKAARETADLQPVTTETRDLFRRPLLASELKKFDVVVIDPPRAGAKAQCAEIVASSINKIAFVSCNPVTFARDAAVLVDAGFVIDWVKTIDQFRWSPHVEMVASFTRS